MKNKYQAGIVAACIALSACNETNEPAVTGEPLTLSGPVEKVVLLEAEENSTAVTFNWNKGIDRAPTDTVTYIFRMDIAGRDFATATPRDTVTDFTRSFTTGELNELIAMQWQVRPGEEVDLEARVVANIRGEKFVYPEIAVIKFSIVTYTYASVPLYLTGSANPGYSPVALTETVNGRSYRWQGTLNTGGFKFVYSPDSDLPSLNRGADNSTLIERTGAGQPDDLFPAGQSGLYIISLDRKNLKIDYRYFYYAFAQIYPVGSATSVGWSLGNMEVKWNDETPGLYVWEDRLREGEFKIHTDKSWGGGFRPMENNGSITSTAVQYTATESEKGDLKWYVKAAEAGNYRITLDVSEMKIYFVKL
jgi:hypothetical protein